MSDLAAPSRPALAALAAAPHTTTIRKLWKALSPEERALGISAALEDDDDGWVKNTTRGAVASALRFRPQSVATWPRARLVSEGARLPLDNVQLLSAFLIDLHLGHRRTMMASFLDSLGIPNDDGRIDSEKTDVAPQGEEKLVAAANALSAEFPPDQVVTYFLTLLLQDGAVWKGLGDWMEQQVRREA